MLKHEQFEQLCALAAGGQLTAEEQRRLDEHLEDCAECRAACMEFSLILRELPPDDDAADEKLVRHAEKSHLRERFFEAARAEGVAVPEDLLKGPAAREWEFPRIPGMYQWIGIGSTVIVLVAYFAFRTTNVSPRHPSTVSSHVEPLPGPPAASTTQGSVTRETEIPPRREPSDEPSSRLKRENALLVGRVQALEKRLAAIQSERQALSNRNVQLASESEQNAQLLTGAKTEIEKLRDDRTATEAQLAAQTAQVEELSQQVRLQAASLDREKGLLVAGRDVRDIMGARQLYMIDVYDSDEKGKNRKSFGRVFYTEGKSLIFYAFDLDDKKVTNAKYSYEVWGERLGQPASIKSLGLLFSDDKAQRRWVLKIDDPQQIAEIDSVFVTVEPHEGGEKPSGKKILYAFLGGKANHP
jgi:Putative zinc-finger